MILRRWPMRIVSALSFTSLVFCSCAGPSLVKLPVTRDTVAWMYRGEPAFDFGAAEPLFVEGVHYVALLGFDVSAARGKNVRSARLWLHRSDTEPLRSLLLSTISVDWIEGQGKGDGPDLQASCAAYVRIDPGSGKPQRWAGPGSDITDVILSQGNTLSAQRDVSQASGGWQTVEVPPTVVQSLVSGDSYGLVLMDAKGQLRDQKGGFIAKRFHSRSAGKLAPFLEVNLEPAPPGAPEPPSGLAVLPAPDEAGFGWGAARVVVHPRGQGEKRGFCYEMVASASPLDSAAAESAERVPRRLLPHISDSETDTVLLQNLPPQDPLYVGLRTVDRCGHRSAWAFAEGSSSSALDQVGLVSPARPSLGGKIKVWACGADEKVNPLNGRLLEENPGLYALEGESDYDYMYNSHLWNAASSTVSLDVPRGGVAAFHLVVEPESGALDGISVKAEPVRTWGGGPAGFSVRLYKDWYLRSPGTGAWYPEVAVPLEGPLSIPDPSGPVAGQRNQMILCEIAVPVKANPGKYLGKLMVGARGLLARMVTLDLNVHQTALEQKLPFVSELNCYGPVSGQYRLGSDTDEYFDLEQQYYRMAHDHLCVLNQLPYSQNGSVRPSSAPALEGEGDGMRVADWSLWDRRFGRYLDASAFSSSDRPAPVPVMYLPFHENWPAGLRQHYRFTPTDTTYPGMINEHALAAPPIDQAFDPAYEQAFVSVLRQFAGHFREKGWLKTEFQVFLNNKYYYKNREQGGRGISWWLLDEPYQWDDFQALAYFGRLFMRAVGDVHDVNLVFRMDLSRPHLQFGSLDSLRSVTYSSTFFYTKNAYLRWRKKTFGQDMRHYGSLNNLEETNLNATAWPLEVYLNGGTGLIPWQTIGSDNNFDSFQNTAVLYPGLRFGIRGPVASLRLKALRSGTELVALLDLLEKRKNWTRDQTALAVAGHLDLGSRTVSEFFDDAGRVSFDKLSPSDLSALRQAVLRSLDNP